MLPHVVQVKLELPVPGQDLPHVLQALAHQTRKQRAAQYASMQLSMHATTAAHDICGARMGAYTHRHLSSPNADQVLKALVWMWHA